MTEIRKRLRISNVSLKLFLHIFNLLCSWAVSFLSTHSVSLSAFEGFIRIHTLKKNCCLEVWPFLKEEAEIYTLKV